MAVVQFCNTVRAFLEQMVRELMKNIVHSGLTISEASIDMDASIIFQNLLDHNAAKRVEILIVMRRLVKNGNGHLPFRNTTKDAVFEVLHHVLDDVRWEVRYQCLLLISAIIPSANEDLDPCMILVMPKIIANLGHENMNIRRAALQVLHVHMKYTNNLQQFQHMFIQYGLESHDYITRKGCIMSISVLFTSDFANENLYPLVECLSKHFVHGDASLFYPIFLAMQKLNELVGAATFESYLQKIDVEAVNTYKRVLNKFYFSDSRLTHSLNGNRSISSGNLNRSLDGLEHEIFQLEFGLFEPHIIEKIRDEDWKTRIEGLEHMKIVLKEAPDLPEQLTDVDEYLTFLSRLLEDPNFKIVILALGMYELLIDKFRKEIRHFLRSFVLTVSKRLGDSKLVVREHAVKVIHKLMHHVRPTEVLNFLLEGKSHRNPRLREEIINRITAGVLTFPSYSFEFSVLCEAVAPLLVDPKRRVRLAALECFAVLAQAMGPTRMIPLVSAVDAVEINFDGEGLLSAVQARLARRILPRCTEDGTVTFAVTLPSSASYQSHGDSACGADIDWVMSASGSSSSSTPPSRSRETPSLNHAHRESWSSRRKETRAPRSSKTYRQSWAVSKKPETSLSSSCPDEIAKASENLHAKVKNSNEALPRSSSQDLENNRSQLSSSSQSSEESNPTKEHEKKSEENHQMWKSPQLSDNRRNRAKSPHNISKLHEEQKLPQDLNSIAKENAPPAKRIQRGSANFGNRLLPNRLKLNSEGAKPRGVSSNSKIPVLTTNFARNSAASEDSQILVRPTLARTLSAGRQHFLPNHNSRYSASYHKFSNAVVYDNGVKLDYDSDSGNAIMRRVSPDDSPFGSKAILVRSPSLTHLQHIPQRDPRAVTPTSYDSYISTAENMGNVSSYFRPSPGGVIMAQPTPVHLDEVNDVNVIGVAVLDDSLKPSSPSPHSWPSAELFKPGSGGSSKNESWHKPVSSMPEVYGVNLNYNFTSPTNPNFSQELVASINGMDNTNISISKITREKMLKRQQEILKEAEERRVARERSQQERKQMLERRLQEERERQQRQQMSEEISNSITAAEEPPAPSEKQNNEPEIPQENIESSVKPHTPPPKTATPNNSSCDSQTLKRTDSTSSKEGSAKSLHRSSSLKTPSTVRKFAQLAQSSTKNMSSNMSTLSKRNLAASSLALFDDTQNSISPYPHPDEALKKALKSLSTETWMGKIEGIQTISRLAQVHPNVLLPQLHPVVLALLTEVKNLRSSVSRAAILTIGDLFAALRRNMEQDLELVTSTLLNKSGETVGFIRDDIEKVMKHLVDNITPNKAALAIIAGGASHRNGAVRKTAAHSLLSVVEKMGAVRILTTAKDVTERLLPTTAHFVMDATPLTRYYGRRIFHLLMQHPNFDKLLTRYVQPSTLRNISSILDSVRKKGVGEKPKEGVSARSHKTEVHRSGLLNRTM